jgi:uncharacterized protein (TIGR02996 family)
MPPLVLKRAWEAGSVTDRESLLATVLDNPADDTARLVLADLLRESDDADQKAQGRLLWAGVVAATFRTEELIEDRLFYTAQAELAAVAATGYPARWLSSLGLGPSPLPQRGWAWDNIWDRVSIRIGGVVGVFARGMLCELSVTREEWSAVAGASIAAWPLERVTVTDVPGLVFSIDRKTDGWTLTARLKLPGRKVSVTGRAIRRGDSSGLALTVGAADWRLDRVFPSRTELVAGVASASTALVANMRIVAGDLWPPPPRKRR